MKRTVAFIMAGGASERLSVLSEERAKPAVPFGAKYRIIDFALSNCANSGISRVGVLTQYQPRSLSEHIGDGGPWGLDRDEDGVMLLQPYLDRQRLAGWYAGNADAVYQNLFLVRDYGADTILILAGDHIYVMDYTTIIDFHRAQQADFTVGVTPVLVEDASQFGLVTLDSQSRITAFEEKPAQPSSDLASMGIYVFRADFLMECLLADAADPTSEHDFGRNILPQALRDGAAGFGFRFSDYWRDVGTIKAYWEASMDLLAADPALRLDQPGWRITTREPKHPPARLGPQAQVQQSLIGAGATIEGTVLRSIISPAVSIGPGAVVQDSIIFHRTHVSPGARIDRSIIDKDVVVGDGACIGRGPAHIPNRATPTLVNIGINIIGKRAFIPSGFTVYRTTVIGPRVGPELEGLGELSPGETVRSSREWSPLTI